MCKQTLKSYQFSASLRSQKTSFVLKSLFTKVRILGNSPWPEWAARILRLYASRAASTYWRLKSRKKTLQPLFLNTTKNNVERHVKVGFFYLADLRWSEKVICHLSFTFLLDMLRKRNDNISLPWKYNF